MTRKTYYCQWEAHLTAYLKGMQSKNCVHKFTKVENILFKPVVHKHCNTNLAGK